MQFVNTGPDQEGELLPLTIKRLPPGTVVHGPRMVQESTALTLLQIMRLGMNLRAAASHSSATRRRRGPLLDQVSGGLFGSGLYLHFSSHRRSGGPQS